MINLKRSQYVYLHPNIKRRRQSYKFIICYKKISNTIRIILSTGASILNCRTLVTFTWPIHSYIGNLSNSPTSSCRPPPAHSTHKTSQTESHCEYTWTDCKICSSSSSGERISESTLPLLLLIFILHTCTPNVCKAEEWN